MPTEQPITSLSQLCIGAEVYLSKIGVYVNVSRHTSYAVQLSSEIGVGGGVYSLEQLQEAGATIRP